jgi:peroxiredoxin
MRLRSLVSLAALLALGSPAVTAPQVPREAPALTVTDVMGQKQDLSQFKGDVMVIEFMLIRCQHCLQLAKTINKLYGEMAGRGFQPVGVVFDEGVTDPVIRDLANLLQLNYPVGYTTSDDVDRYLDRGANVRLQVPQLVVIDRAGVIRAQGRPGAETGLTEEAYLRNLIGTLLFDRAPSPSATASPSK